MARRALPSIPTGSMADIAFLLLVFWLMTTTLESDSGILRRLPPIDLEDNSDIVKKKNVYEVLVNFRNELLIEGEPGEISQLKAGAMEFLTNTGVFKEEAGDEEMTSRTWVRKSDVQEKVNYYTEEYEKAIKEEMEDSEIDARKKVLGRWQSKLDAINFFGEYRELIPAAVVSLQNDKGTNYDTYIAVQNELASALGQLRDDLCMKHWKRKFSDLDDKIEKDKVKILAVRNVFPNRISEAEPKDSGN